MIDLEMLEFSLGLVESSGRDIAEIKCESVRELIERLRQAEKDADRYRWLRNCDTVESKKFVSEAGGWIVGLSVLDGLIDEAMNA